MKINLSKIFQVFSQKSVYTFVESMDFWKKHKSSLCILHPRELLQPRQTQMILEGFPVHLPGNNNQMGW